MRFCLLKLRLLLFIAVLGTVFSWHRVSIQVSATNAFINVGETGNPPVVMTTWLVTDAKEIFQSVNLERRKKGLTNLVWDEKVSAMATAYSKKMAEKKFFSHFDPDGKSIVDRAQDAEINDWTKIGENLFHSERVVSPTEIAIEGWKDSKTHRENMFDKAWTHTGVGVFKTKAGDTYITQVFIQR